MRLWLIGDDANSKVVNVIDVRVQLRNRQRWLSDR